MAEPVLTFDTLDSTNAEARRRAAKGDFGPAWLMARRQSAGRGRRGRDWDAGYGNLTTTLLTTTDKGPQEAAQLAFVAALAVGDLADAYVPPHLVTFKWPNDVLIEGRKAAGILIESGPDGAGGLWLAVGIGVNLATYPDGMPFPATSFAERGSAPQPDEAMDRLASAFAGWTSIWQADGFDVIRRAWTQRAAGMDAECEARLPQETVRGIAEGLDADGALLLRLPDGAQRRITAGDVFFGAA